MKQKIADDAPEWLIIEGLISADERFSLLSGRTQSLIRHRDAKGGRPSPHTTLQLLDGSGDRLFEAPAMIHTPTICHEFEPAHHRLFGQLPMLAEAATLLIQRDGREIYRRHIGTPPRLSVTWPKQRLRRGKRHTLELKLSKPDDPQEALLILAIHWGTKSHRIIGVCEPSEKLSFDPADFPGDKHTRLCVTYQTGFRATTRFSPRYAMTPLPPRLSMLKPREGATLIAGAPVSLVGEVDDPQGDRSLASALRWLVDGKAVGRGPMALLSDLGVGKHTLALTIEGRKRPTVERRLTVVEAPPLG
jgi:hypothetical protein